MFNIFAPFARASSISSWIYSGFPGSGNGVNLTPSSHGLPNFNSSTFFAKLSLNFDLISSWTYTTFNAVQRWPLKDKVPAKHSLIVKSKSASGKIIAGFLASKPRTKRKRLLFGCWSCKALADLLLPINARTSTFPDCIIGAATVLPLPKITLTTPFGKLVWKASSKGVINSTPCFAGLNMVVLPIIMAGIKSANVSFKG